MASLTATCGFLALSASWFNPLPDLNQYCTVLIWCNVGSSPSKRFNENDFGFSKVPIVLDGLGAISAGALATLLAAPCFSWWWFANVTNM